MPHNEMTLRLGTCPDCGKVNRGFHKCINGVRAANGKHPKALGNPGAKHNYPDDRACDNSPNTPKRFRDWAQIQDNFLRRYGQEVSSEFKRAVARYRGASYTQEAIETHMRLRNMSTGGAINEDV